MNVESILYRGIVNKDFRVTYLYQFESEGPYQTVVDKGSKICVRPSFAITISEGFDKSRMFIPAYKYFQFVLLLKKTIKRISANLYDIFPNINSSEFEVDSRVLERFQTEQAMTSGGMTMVPCVWVDQASQCYPSIRVTSLNGNVVIPLEDAMSISQMLQTFDPHQFGLSVLRILGKIE